MDLKAKALLLPYLLCKRWLNKVQALYIGALSRFEFQLWHSNLIAAFDQKWNLTRGFYFSKAYFSRTRSVYDWEVKIRFLSVDKNCIVVWMPKLKLKSWIDSVLYVSRYENVWYVEVFEYELTAQQGQNVHQVALEFF